MELVSWQVTPEISALSFGGVVTVKANHVVLGTGLTVAELRERVDTIEFLLRGNINPSQMEELKNMYIDLIAGVE